MVYNQSALPARALTNGSFRYYFTSTAPARAITAAYNQCSAPTGPSR